MKILMSLVIVALLVTSMFGTVIAQNESNVTTGPTAGGGGVGGVTEGPAVGGGGGGVITTPVSDVAVYVEPETQKAKPGQWISYEVTVKDLHEPMVCPEPQPGMPYFACDELVYRYKISVEASEGVETEYNKEVTVGAGNKQEIKLAVRGKEEGTYKFLVEAIEIGNEVNRARDSAVLLVVPNGITPKPSRVVFHGDGFLIDEEETKARYIKLTLLSNYEEGMVYIPEVTPLIGRASIGIPTENYKVKGSVEMLGEISLEFYRINRIITTTETVTASVVENEEEAEEEVSEIEEITTSETPDFKLTGTLKSYREIKILKGELTGIYENWKLTAFSRVKVEITEGVTVSKKGEVEVVSGVSTSEVIPLKKEKEEKPGVYIQPIKIYKPKILYIIPNPFAKRIVEARVISEEEISIIKIKEGESRDVGPYIVTATNLQDEKNIELEISRK